MIEILPWIPFAGMSLIVLNWVVIHLLSLLCNESDGIPSSLIRVDAVLLFTMVLVQCLLADSINRHYTFYAIGLYPCQWFLVAIMRKYHNTNTWPL